MLIGIDPFAISSFGGSMLGYPLPWFEVCKDEDTWVGVAKDTTANWQVEPEVESTWDEINRIELDIVRCDHAT